MSIGVYGKTKRSARAVERMVGQRGAIGQAPRRLTLQGHLSEQILDGGDHLLGALQVALQLHPLRPQLLVFGLHLLHLLREVAVLGEQTQVELLEAEDVGLEEFDVGVVGGEEVGDGGVSEGHPKLN